MAPNGNYGLSGAGQAVQLRMVLTVIKIYRYIVYVEIFVTINCRAGRNDGHHSKPIYGGVHVYHSDRNVN